MFRPLSEVIGGVAHVALGRVGFPVVHHPTPAAPSAAASSAVKPNQYEWTPADCGHHPTRTGPSIKEYRQDNKAFLSCSQCGQRWVKLLGDCVELEPYPWIGGRLKYSTKEFLGRQIIQGGQHHGRTVKEVTEKHPGYVQWAMGEPNPGITLKQLLYYQEVLDPKDKLRPTRGSASGPRQPLNNQPQIAMVLPPPGHRGSPGPSTALADALPSAPTSSGPLQTRSKASPSAPPSRRSRAKRSAHEENGSETYLPEDHQEGVEIPSPTLSLSDEDM
jgi:hypothetical protein